MRQSSAKVNNSYVMLESQKIPIVFDGRNIPKTVTISNLANKQADTVTLSEDISRVFVPNRGALYYHLEDYNEKSILEIHFDYLYVRVKQLNLLSEFNNITAHLTTAATVKSFSCSPIHPNNSFAFKNISLCIA